MGTRTRIAPSPTGFAHVGTAYTALMNHAYARSKNGTFIIRIEDSDLKRNIEGAEGKIYEALIWLGIDWDEGTTKGGEFGPYKLSERLELYKSKADELVKAGRAYEDDGAIRFKNPGEEVSWEDAIRGKIVFSGDQITDFVIMKSDGYPTYNFNVVVDDIAMQITHVIRGDDHVSNTPRQIALYKAFETKPPVFAHHAVLVNSEKKKLSKRDAAVDIMAYKQMGILSEAFVNFLCLMGWSHPEGKEIFDLNEFTEKFSLDRVRPSGAYFNLEKLLWLNSEYIKSMADNSLATSVVSFFDNKFQMQEVLPIIPLIKERINTLKQFETIAVFFFQAPEVDQTLFGENSQTHLKEALIALETTDIWNLENINECLMAAVKKYDFHTGKFFMDLRVAITGQKVTPPLNESLVILNKEETLKRIKSALHAPEKIPH